MGTLLDDVANELTAPEAAALMYAASDAGGGSYQDEKILMEVLIGQAPVRSFSAATAPALTDRGAILLHPSADTTARTVTIPANASVAFPVGSTFTIINQDSAGVLTIAITSDTLRLAGAGTTGSRTLAANGVATLVKLTSTEWIISGVGLT
jgi:hypothetical protein